MIGGPTRDSASVTLAAFLLIGLFDFLAVRLQRHNQRGSGADSDRGSFQIIRVAQVGGFIVGASAPRFLPSLQLTSAVWLPVSLGLLLAGAGLALRLWAINTLGRSFVRVVSIELNQPLVTRGPYHYLRHPSYSGVLLAFLGLGLAFDNAVGFAAVLLPLPAYLYRISIEETALNQAFGSAYQDYKLRTRALIPGLW